MRGVHRVAWAISLTVVLVLLATSLFAWRVVYRPRLDQLPPGGVDALLVLGPLDPWRLEMAEQLMRDGRARNLVLSTPNMPWDAIYCDRDHDWPAYCFPPDPSTTRGEAIGLKRLAEAHGWQSFAVLTVDFHAARSRFIFQRCLGVDVPVVGSHQPSLDGQRPYQVAYQAGAFAKEITLGRCPA
ncbi:MULTISPECIES: YdcF family protein [unclassified Luteococcus]|uniref:YdcF family protein n=1 Tax=unclassified Luteococcus TaxID=2639923 RepID=UPI00313CAEDC